MFSDLSRHQMVRDTNAMRAEPKVVQLRMNKNKQKVFVRTRESD